MKPKLPRRLRKTTLCLASAVSACVYGQDEDPPPEPIEELVFVDTHFDDVDRVDGIDGSYDMAISPDGLFLYVAAMNDDAIAIFSRDSGVGELTFVTRVKNGEGVVEGLNGARSLVVSRDGARSIAISADGMNLSVAGWVDDALADSRPANSAD